MFQGFPEKIAKIDDINDTKQIYENLQNNENRKIQSGDATYQMKRKRSIN